MGEIVVMPSESVDPSRWINLRIALPLVWQSGRRQVIAVLGGQLLGGLMIGAQLAVLGRVLSRMIDGTDSTVRSLLPLLSLFAVLLVGAGLVTLISDASRDLLSELTSRHVFDELIDISTTIELATFEDPAFHDLFERASTTVEEQSWAVVLGLAGIASGMIGAIAIMVLLVSISPLLVIVLVAGAIPAWVTTRMNGSDAYDFAYGMSPNNRERTYLGGLLTGRLAARELRVFRSARFLRDRFDVLYAERLSAVRTLIARRRRRSVFSAAAAALSTVAAASLVVQFTATGRLTVAQVAVAVAAVQQLGQRLSSSLNGMGSLHEATMFLRDFEQLKAMAFQIAPPDDRPPPAATIVLDDVNFTYPGTTRAVLRDLRLEVPAGQLVALVGENGSGKTTLAKLLCGLYVPTSGRALWRGGDGDEIEISKASARVAALFQDFICYQLQAYDNIALGDVLRFDDDDAVRSVAQAVGMNSELESLPLGYRTRLSREYAGGAELSVGQWQRVAIARALFRDADLLVLDEPTAALDPRAERRLYDQLDQLAAGRTVLFISHRFSSARKADRILVLHEGAIVEDGTHEHLMSLRGRYADLFEMQAQAYGLLEQDST